MVHINYQIISVLLIGLKLQNYILAQIMYLRQISINSNSRMSDFFYSIENFINISNENKTIERFQILLITNVFKQNCIKVAGIFQGIGVD